jgi:hypothetical protein
MDRKITIQEKEELLQEKMLDQAEWCFQFDENDPVVFAWSTKESEPGDFSFLIPAVEGTAAVFKCPLTGKTFKIMVRPMSPETKHRRDSVDLSDLK